MCEPGAVPPPPLFSVVIVNWNGGAHLSACLAALEKQTCRDFEVLVVDNGSTDDSVAIAEAAGALVLPQPRNLGFAAANNLAAARARGRWLALLNNDAFPEADWLERLRAAVAAHPEFSGFGSCQLQAHAPDMLDGVGDAYHVAGVPWRVGLGRPLGPPWDTPREILAPCAAAALYRRDAFLATGGFDESYFCYMEDIDLALRMQLLDHRFGYVPDARVLHVGSGTMGRTSAFARYHGHRNLVWTFVKNMPGRLFWKYLPLHLAFNVASLVRFSLRGEPATIWRAKRDAIAGLGAALRRRRAIQSTRTTSIARLEALLVKDLASLLAESRAR